MKRRQSQLGVTLLEILLVITIGAFLLILGIRQYLAFRTQSDAERIIANVDAIFLAMGHYYKAQCYGKIKDDEFKPGKLYPTSSSYQDHIAIDIRNDLIEDNYLNVTLPIVALVNSSGIGTNGYVAQFNMDDSQSRKVCVEGDNANGPNSSGCEKTKKIGKIVTGVIQVSVNMKDAATAQTYLKYLGADCLSNATGNYVEPCGSSSGSGTYLVWQRLPSFASPRSQSGQVTSNATMEQFRQMYTTYPVNYLLGSGGEDSGGDTQYFVCGS